MDSLLRKLRGDTRPTQYWTVEWSHNSAASDGIGQWFVGPDAEREAREFAAALGVDATRGYVRVKDVTP